MQDNFNGILNRCYFFFKLSALGHQTVKTIVPRKIPKALWTGYEFINTLKFNIFHNFFFGGGGGEEKRDHVENN